MSMDPTRGADAGIALPTTTVRTQPMKEERKSMNRWMSPSVDAKDPEVCLVGVLDCWSYDGHNHHVGADEVILFYFISMTDNEMEWNTVPP